MAILIQIPKNGWSTVYCIDRPTNAFSYTKHNIKRNIFVYKKKPKILPQKKKKSCFNVEVYNHIA